MFGLVLGNWKLIVAGLAALTIVTIIGLGYRHYVGLTETITTLGANNAKLDVAIGIQQGTIIAQKSSISEWKKAQEDLLLRIDELQEVSKAATAETRRLNGIFSKHNLTALARRKPGLIERRINTGTDAAQRMLECTSGAGGDDCADGHRPPTGASPTTKP